MQFLSVELVSLSIPLELELCLSSFSHTLWGQKDCEVLSNHNTKDKGVNVPALGEKLKDVKKFSMVGIGIACKTD
jgi:hypothetical protein